MVELIHNKGIDMLKLGCTLPNLANIWVHSSSSAKFYPLTESGKDLLSKSRDDTVVGPSRVFIGKAVVYETQIRKSTNVYKSIVGKDAGQLYTYLMYDPMPSGLSQYTSLMQICKDSSLGRTNLEASKKMFESYFQRMRPDCRIENFYTAGTQKKTDCFNADRLCGHCNTV